jgi:UDP-glucose 4-epimerase
MGARSQKGDKMKAFVTGAAGFIGGNLVRKLLEKDYEVIGFDKKKCSAEIQSVQGDIGSFDLSEVLENVDIVYHLASLLGTAELFERVVEAERVNVLGTVNLLEAMRKNDVDKIVFTTKPNVWKFNVYTITKENCERYLEMYKSVYGFKTILARPFNIYGPDEMLTEYRKAIPYFIVAALKGEPLEVFGDGEQTLDPIYVDDAVEALFRCGKLLPEETVEIGSCKPIKVGDLAQRILDLTHSDSHVVHVPMRSGETCTSIICANGNSQRLIGFSPKVSLEAGLRRTITWYSDHLEDFRTIYTFKHTCSRARVKQS